MKKKLAILFATMLCLSACAQPGTNDTTNPDTNNPGGGETEQGGGSEGGNTNPDQGGGNEGGNTDPDQGGGNEGGGDEGGGTGPEETKDQIFSVTEKADLTLYRDTNKPANTFIKHDGIYKVGDDNAFNFKPVVEVIDKDDNEVVKDVAISYKLEVYDAEATTPGYVAVENPTTYVEAYDEIKCDIDFKAEAVGKQFKITYAPKDLTEEQKTKDKYYHSLEFQVIDAYNVYRVEELGYINNKYETFPTIGSLPTRPMNVAWDEFKDAHDMDKTLNVNGVVLHKDFKLVKEAFPADYFINEAEAKVITAEHYQDFVGKLKDRITFYQREMKDDETFEIAGNYFTLNCEDFPRVGLPENSFEEGAKSKLSHSNFFRFQASTQSQVNMENINVIGNSPLTDAKYNGLGMIFHKADGPNFKATNVTSTRFFITFCPEELSENSNYIIDSCAMSDTYNVFVYNFGCKNCVIKNSTMKHSGGPSVLNNHAHLSSSNPGITSNTTIINCDIDSYVAGTESWFVELGEAVTSKVGLIKSLDGIFNLRGKTFLKDGKFNFKALNNGSAEGMGDATIAGQTRGNITFKANEEDEGTIYNYFQTPEGNDSPITQAYLKCLAQQPMPAPVFQTNGGAIFYFNGEQIVSFTGATQSVLKTQISASTEFCLYFAGMALIFSLDDLPEA